MTNNLIYKLVGGAALAATVLVATPVYDKYVNLKSLDLSAIAEPKRGFLKPASYDRIDNIIGEFYAFSEVSTNEILTSELECLVRVYNSKKRNEKVHRPKTDRGIVRFLEQQEFDVIEIYALNDLEQQDRPSAIIYRFGNIAYSHHGKGKNGLLADGTIDPIELKVWGASLISATAEDMLMERLKALQNNLSSSNQ